MFNSAEDRTHMGHAFARSWGNFELGRLRGFNVAPFSASGNFSSLHDFQGVDALTSRETSGALWTVTTTTTTFMAALACVPEFAILLVRSSLGSLPAC